MSPALAWSKLGVVGEALDEYHPFSPSDRAFDEVQPRIKIDQTLVKLNKSQGKV